MNTTQEPYTIEWDWEYARAYRFPIAWVIVRRGGQVRHARDDIDGGEEGARVVHWFGDGGAWSDLDDAVLDALREFRLALRLTKL